MKLPSRLFLVFAALGAAWTGKLTYDQTARQIRHSLETGRDSSSYFRVGFYDINAWNDLIWLLGDWKVVYMVLLCVCVLCFYAYILRVTTSRDLLKDRFFRWVHSLSIEDMHAKMRADTRFQKEFREWNGEQHEELLPYGDFFSQMCASLDNVQKNGREQPEAAVVTTPPPDIHEAAILLAAGYDAEMISDMSVPERAAEVAQAIEQGVVPIDDNEAARLLGSFSAGTR